MQEITVTPALLKQFSREFMRCPCTMVDNPYNVGADHIILVAWIHTMLNSDVDDIDTITIAFSGWLCGRGEFVLFDEPAYEKEFAEVLVATCNEVIDIQKGIEDAKES